MRQFSSLPAALVLASIAIFSSCKPVAKDPAGTASTPTASAPAAATASQPTTPAATTPSVAAAPVATPAPTPVPTEVAYQPGHEDADPAPTASMEQDPNAPEPIPVDDAWFGQIINESAGTVNFALPGGLAASGSIDLLEKGGNGEPIVVQGRLTSPQPGFYTFQRQTAPGVAGAYFGHVRFDDSEQAYRLEPIGPGGTSMLVPRKLDQVICVGMPPAQEDGDSADTAQAATDPQYVPQTHPTNGPYPPSQNGIVPLESLPGASAVVFLDFEGGPGPWVGWGNFAAQPANVSNAQIKEVWQRVAEDFQPFNINITTNRAVFEAAPRNSRQRVIVTPTNTAAPGAGGVAVIGSFNSTSDQVCWAFYTSGKASAEAISHEVGHTLGLSHDGKGSEGYYGGHGNDPVGWAPIMGVGYYKNLSQWSKGEYAGATQTEDDLRIITNNNNTVRYRADDYGATFATAGHLEVYENGSVSNEGIIETREDVDAFRFTTTGGVVSFTVNPVSAGPNLDLLAEIYDSANVLKASNNPPNDINATVTANLPAGDYTLRVSGVGRGDPLGDGYSDYGSIGAYVISGTAPQAIKPARFSIPENSPFNTTVGTITPRNSHGGNPITFSITSGNSNGAFSINSTTGVLRVANPSALNYETLSTRWDDPATIECVVSITDSANPALNESIRVVVTVTNVNEPPILTGGTVTVFSRTRVGTEIFTVDARDPDHFDFPTLAIVGGDPEGRFAINDRGVITIKSALETSTAVTIPLTIRATDQGNPALSTEVTVNVDLRPLVGVYRPGGIVRTYYEDISGNPLSALTNAAKFPNSPDSQEALTSFDGGQHGERYGSTITGFLIPPATGSYTFWIASDDASELRLSSNSDPANATVRASVSGATGRYAFDQNSSQKSAAITLIGGNVYYIEARHKEGVGDDHVTVAWQGPGFSRRVISGLYLAPSSINRAPTIPAATMRVRRDAYTGATVGTVTIRDFNPLDTHTTRIIAGTGIGIFDVEPHTGRIFVKDAAALAAATGTSYTLLLEATDDGSPSMSGRGAVTIQIVASDTLPTNGIVRQIWRNFNGSLSALPNHPGYPGSPDITRTLTSFEAPHENLEYFGSRIRAYVVPPTTGTYRFYISSDDDSALYLSTSENPAAAAQIASVNGWVDPRSWTAQPGQASAARTLIAGRRYYIEVRHRQGIGGEDLAVAWTGPGITTPTIIPGSALQPFNLNDAPTWSGSNSFSTIAGSAPGTFVGKATATDPEGEELAYTIVSGNDSGAFAINPATGEITVADGSAIHPGSTTNLVIGAQDRGLKGEYPLRSVTRTFTISADNSRIAMRARRNAYPGATIGFVVPPGGGSSFSVSGGTGAAIFDVDPTTGRVFVKDASALAAAAQSSVTLNVATTNHGTYAVTIDLLAADAIQATGIVRQVFTNFTGSLASLPNDPRYPNSPTYSRVLSSFDASTEFRQNFGSRIRAYIVPPTTGSYRFYISSDEESILLLSPNDNPAGAVQVASVSGYVDPRSWTAQASQASTARTLTAGQRYYIEVRHRQTTGGDDLAVAWTGPGIASPVVIPGSALRPFNINGAPAFTGAPYSFSVPPGAVEGTFVGQVAGTDPEGDSLTYAIVGGNEGGAFAIDPLSGRITVANRNALPGGSATLTVGVQDDGQKGVYPLMAATTTVNVAITGGIEAWRQTKFGADAGNADIAGNLADPDGDGLANVMEYALGLDPLSSDADAIKIDEAVVNGARYLRLGAPRNPDAKDVILTIEVTSNLADSDSWSSSDTVVEVDTPTQLRARDKIPMGASPARCIRVKATIP